MRWTRRALIQDALLAAGVVSLPDFGADGRGGIALAAPNDETLIWKNWAGDHACSPKLRAAPADEDSLVELLRTATGTIRPVGAGHSFSPLVPCEDTLIACDQMSGVIDYDSDTMQAEAWAGTRLHELGPALERVGQALINQPDIDDQALGGALATSTHGTGKGLGSLSAYVTGLTLATPSGDLIECDAERDADVFHAARCSMGSLGIVTRVRMQNRAPYRLRETTQMVSMDELLEEASDLRDAHRHMEFMALPHSGLGLLVTTNETESDNVELEEDPQAVYGLREAWESVGQDGDVYRQALKMVLGRGEEVRKGPSHRVLAHDRFVRFREMEYTVPADQGPACLAEILLTIKRDEIQCLFPIEYRYVAADDVWLSMFSGRDGASISIHEYADQDHRPIFDAIEPIFWRYEGRPHWGKWHSLDAARLAPHYAHWDDFASVRDRLDPKGRMLNAHLASVLGAEKQS